MTERGFDSQIDCSADQNDMVPVLLGFLKIVDDISLRIDTGGAVASPAKSPHGAATSGDEEIVLAVLGLLSVHRTIHRWLAQYEPRPLPSDSTNSEIDDTKTGLLR